MTISDVDRIDLYTCFPVAVESFAEALKVPLDGELTVTGGMPFAGGPFNNYVLQSTARMAQLLRAQQGAVGLVTSVSGVLTKQGFGLWSSAEPGSVSFASIDVTRQVAQAQATKSVVEAYRGPGTIVGLTVLAGEPAPRAVAVIDVGDARTVAHALSSRTVDAFQTTECCGRAVTVDGETFALD